MNRLRRDIVVIVSILCVLLAGLMVGRLWGRFSQTPAPEAMPDKSHAWLADQMKFHSELSAVQRQQMDAIWGQTRQDMGKLGEQRRAMDKERDEAVRDLLTDQQKHQYDAIYSDFRTRREELDKQRDKLLADSNARSRALLDPEQQKKWDELTRQREHMRERRGATQPATMPLGPGGPDGGLPPPPHPW